MTDSYTRAGVGCMYNRLPFYQDKLHEEKVFKRFAEILSKARSNKQANKPDAELNEFETVRSLPSPSSSSSSCPKADSDFGRVWGWLVDRTDSREPQEVGRGRTRA